MSGFLGGGCVLVLLWLMVPRNERALSFSLCSLGLQAKGVFALHGENDGGTVDCA